ncbi:MAG: hypothetical protein ACRD2W_06345 [Acidimicrobiales bacterium]
MTRSSRRPEVEALVAAYRADLVAAGMFAEHPVTSPARSFLSRVGPEGWAALSLAEQCALEWLGSLGDAAFTDAIATGFDQTWDGPRNCSAPCSRHL